MNRYFQLWLLAAIPFVVLGAACGWISIYSVTIACIVGIALSIVMFYVYFFLAAFLDLAILGTSILVGGSGTYGHPYDPTQSHLHGRRLAVYAMSFAAVCVVSIFLSRHLLG